jgi:hypothetical protein
MNASVANEPVVDRLIAQRNGRLLAREAHGIVLVASRCPKIVAEKEYVVRM